MVQPDLAIGDALARYLAACRRRNLRSATIFYYQTAIERFAAGRCVTLADFTREKVADFQDNSPTLSAGSMKGYDRLLGLRHQAPPGGGDDRGRLAPYR